MKEYNKLEQFKSEAQEFKDKIAGFRSVSEIAIFGSVASGDPYPSDVDIALFLNSFDDLPVIAKAKRQAGSKTQGFDVFVFKDGKKFIGNICFRKDCPTSSVDCAVEGCGEIKYIRIRDGLDPDPVRWFKYPVDVIFKRSKSSFLLTWQKEILNVLGLKALKKYEFRETIIRKCKECGKRFELDPGEQKHFEKKGLYLPKRCQECRDQRFKEEMDEDLNI